MTVFLDKRKYEKAKRIADEVYDLPSAYKSGFIVKKYKELGGKFGDEPVKSKSKADNKPLSRWFKEKWVNQHGETGYAHKNDVYRPSVRVTKQTPATWTELPSKTVEKAKRSKSKGKRAAFGRSKGPNEN